MGIVEGPGQHTTGMPRSCYNRDLPNVASLRALAPSQKLERPGPIPGKKLGCWGSQQGRTSFLPTAWQLPPGPGPLSCFVLLCSVPSHLAEGPVWLACSPLPGTADLQLMSHSASWCLTVFASFVGSHQAHRCSLQMHKVRVSQQGHPVFFLDSLSCIVLALMAANPSRLLGPDPWAWAPSKLRLWM